MNRQHGFTLVELIITMAIAAILMTVAVPSFTTTIKNNRLVTQANLLVASIGLARSEAVKLGRTATVCVSSDQATCTGETNWSLGWMVWVDADGDNLLDAGEERRFEGALPGTTFTSAATQLTGETGRRISISNTGRANTADLVGVCV